MLPTEVALLPEHAHPQDRPQYLRTGTGRGQGCRRHGALSALAARQKEVEMLFAHLKRIMKMDRLRLRGPTGAHDEFQLAAIAQNLRRMAKRLCPQVPMPMFAGT